MKPAKITSLWEIVAALQRRLEAYGLEDELVDAAVVRGLEEALVPRPRRPRPLARARKPLFGLTPVVAKA